ncbi:MAG: plasma-membrane proton-efflux P-type ATPase [Aggregatilineales bacterium]
MVTEAISATGLSSQVAQQRLQQNGPNAIPEEHPHLLALFLHKFWGTVPWMLEASIVIQLVLGRYVDVLITFALLLLNALLSFVQESRAQNALALLRQSLSVQARVRRDGQWQLIPAQSIVPGDVVHLRTGDLIPADLRLIDGHISADQSALTGESVPAELNPNDLAHAGSIVKQGESTGEVTATGSHTAYGKTAELVHTAKTIGHLETMIQTIVKYLIAVNAILVILILVYALVNHLPLTDLLPFILIILVASIPVALPATFTLAGALGSLELSRRGVLVTRLSALQEAAGMDILCSDKTGTITANELSLAAIQAYPPYTEHDLLTFAAVSSDNATQDPIDLAILNGVHQRGGDTHLPTRLKFVPFDSATKRTEATVRQGDQTLRVVKGFPEVVAGLVGGGVDLEADVKRLAGQGYRVLAVAAGQDTALKLVGLLGLQDQARPDSKNVIEKLRTLGLKIIMVTGDSQETAKAVGAQVGIVGHVCLAETLHDEKNANSQDCDIFAGVFPEDKFKLVRGLQQAGHVVGMTGDGVNDAPALKQAEVGVAVSNATDVAKAAASLVLTKPGLSDMLTAVEVGRRIYQRMLTYTLNKIIKTFQVGLFLSLGLLLTGIMVTRPRLILLLIFANDFVTMSLATDHVSPSPKPDRWNVRSLVIIALVLALAWVVFAFGVLLVGQTVLNLDLAHLQTLIFVMLVFSGQANVYLIRERQHFWHSRPSRWLVLSTAIDVIIISILATQGVLMVAIGPLLVAGLLGITVGYMFALDFLKISIFRRFNPRFSVHQRQARF